MGFAATPLLTRFWRNVDQQGDGCWPWMGTIGRGGYGQIWDTPNRKTILAHRLSYEVNIGPIPAGKDLDHTCHNADPECSGGRSCQHRACVNPSHLEPVLRGTNTLRGKTITARFATVTHCPQGHEYTPQNTIHDQKGRQCRACGRARSAFYGPRIIADRKSRGMCIRCESPPEPERSECRRHLDAAAARAARRRTKMKEARSAA